MKDLARSKEVLEDDRLVRALGTAGDMGAGEAWAPAKRAPRTGTYFEKCIAAVVKLCLSKTAMVFWRINKDWKY